MDHVEKWLVDQANTFFTGLERDAVRMVATRWHDRRDFPEPTTVPTALNVQAGADCLQFLVDVVRSLPTMDLNDEDLNQFQETNWDTLVMSMRAWATALEESQP